jgi:hypothetical protein
MVLSMPLTSLKGRSRIAQTIFVAGTLALLVVGFLAIGFVTAHL